MDVEQAENPKPKGAEIRREVLTIRPTTSTRAAIRITITQRLADNNGEVAEPSTIISGTIPIYLEKPDILEDLGRAFFVAAHFMRKWSRYAKK